MGASSKRVETPAVETEPTPKPKAPASAKTRTLVQGAAMGVQFAGMLLANKDADNEGIDDYFAMKINQLALEMQTFALTGKLPTDAI